MVEVRVCDSSGNLKPVIAVKKTEYLVNKTVGITISFQETQKNRETAGKTCKNTGKN